MGKEHPHHFYDHIGDNLSRRAFLVRTGEAAAGLTVLATSGCRISLSDGSLSSYIESINTSSNKIYSEGVFKDIRKDQRALAQQLINEKAAPALEQQMRRDAYNLKGDENQWRVVFTDRLKNTLGYLPLVNEAATDIGYSKKSPSIPIIMGMMFVESGGDARVNDGLFQISEPTAQDAYQMLEKDSVSNKVLSDFIRKNMPNTNSIDRNNPKVSVYLALEYFDYLYRKLFPEPSIAVWAYNIGPRGMSRLISAYMTGNSEASPSSLSTDPTVKDGTYYLIKNGKGDSSPIDYIDLYSSNSVQECLKKYYSATPQTTYYTAWVALGCMLLDDYTKYKQSHPH